MNIARGVQQTKTGNGRRGSEKNLPACRGCANADYLNLDFFGRKTNDVSAHAQMTTMKWRRNAQFLLLPPLPLLSRSGEQRKRLRNAPFSLHVIPRPKNRCCTVAHCNKFAGENPCFLLIRELLLQQRPICTNSSRTGFTIMPGLFICSLYDSLLGTLGIVSIVGTS